MPENEQSEKIQEVETLSGWVKAVRQLIPIRIENFRRSMSTKSTSVFKDHEVAETLSTTHDIYAVVPADQAPNNIVPICKKHYVNCINRRV
jgi:hypothetical protein